MFWVSKIWKFGNLEIWKVGNLESWNFTSPILYIGEALNEGWLGQHQGLLRLSQLRVTPNIAFGSDVSRPFFPTSS